MGAALLSIRVLLAATFLVAGGGKLLDVAGGRRALEQFGVPSRAVPTAGYALPGAELAVAAGLLIDPTARYAGVAAALLLVTFIAAIARALSRGATPDCHCFGQLHSEPAGPSTIVRNALLAMLAVTLATAGPGAAIPGGVSHLSASNAGIAIASALVILVALAAASRWGDRVRDLGGRDSHTDPNSAGQAGLQRGAPAPDFELTPLQGGVARLSDLPVGVRPTVLIFLGAGCQTCHQMLPEVARWQDALSDTITVAAIFSGAGVNVEQLSEEHGLKLALVERGTLTFEQYGLRTTPSGVLINADGTIASAAAEGDAAIEALVRAALRRAGHQLRDPIPVAENYGSLADRLKSQ